MSIRATAIAPTPMITGVTILRVMMAAVMPVALAALSAGCAPTDEVAGEEEAHEEVPARADTPSGPRADTTADLPSHRIFPVDEAPRDPAFFAFRARLIRAIADRDTAALLAGVAPDIGLSFGGDAGIDRFREMWFGEAAERSHAGIWTELGAVLALGGRFRDDSTFVAPYTFDPFHPEPTPAAYDPHSALAVLGDAVPVLAAPGGADTLAVLSFDVVRWEWRPSVADPPSGWTAVRLARDSIGSDEGELGFVESAYVRSALDYRAIFRRRDGGWRMSVLIAGD